MPMPVALLILGAWTALRLIVAALTPLAPDEAYYWVWSRALAAGYLDHPPMVALWIRAGTWIAGDTGLGVRLFSPLAAAVGSLLLARDAEDLLPGRRAGFTAAALLNATLLLGAGAVIMTPDTPLLLFWTAVLTCLGRLHATGRGVWWLAAGVAAGLALDSKYTAVLLLPALLLWLLAVPGLRHWLRNPYPWLGGVLAAAVFAPVVWWNAQHGWASFAKQGARTGDWDPARALQFLGELFGGQFLLATPLLALLFGAGIVLAARRGWRRDPAWTLLALLTLLPAVVFVQHAVGDRVQANWPAVLYPAAAIAAAGLAPGWQRLRGPAMALGFAVTAVAYAQATLRPFPVPPQLDPTTRLTGWPDLAAEVAVVAWETKARFVAVEPYGAASELALLLPPDLPVLGLDARWRQFNLQDAGPLVEGKAGLKLHQIHPGDPEPGVWQQMQPLRDNPPGQGGMAGDPYRLYRVSGWTGHAAMVALPRPE